MYKRPIITQKQTTTIAMSSPTPPIFYQKRKWPICPLDISQEAFTCARGIGNMLQCRATNMFDHCLLWVVSDSLDVVGCEWFPGGDSSIGLWIIVLLPAEMDRSWPGSSHCWECSLGTSESSKDWALLNITGLACFAPRDSCNGRRQTGQVDCFLSHTSMQERWKLWPHLGMILSTSFSWYSPKHIEHCVSSIELKASWSNFIVGIAATRTGSRPELAWWCSGCSRSILDSISNIGRDSFLRSLPQMILVQTNTIKVALIPNPITVVIKFIPVPTIFFRLHPINTHPKSQKGKFLKNINKKKNTKIKIHPLFQQQKERLSKENRDCPQAENHKEA